MSTVVFDLETHDADLLYTLSPEDFVRIGGFSIWGSDEVYLTTDIEEMRDIVLGADGVVAHNCHSFDLRALFGYRSDIPLQLAMEERVLDTWVHAVLVHPAPYQYVNRHGKAAIADKPEAMKKWFSLDEQAYQLGVPGKTHDLKALAAEFGGFGEIPVTDERFREYLIGDVRASEAVAKALLKRGGLNAYAKREQKLAAITATISSNGFRVDKAAAQARVDELAQRREVITEELLNRYGLPVEGKAPWDTTAGKVAILAALEDHGITPKSRPDWPKTPVWEKREQKRQESLGKAVVLEQKVEGWKREIAEGNLPPRSVKAREGWIERTTARIDGLRSNPLPPGFGLSFSGDALIELTKDTGASDLGVALSELKGQRSLAQLALDSIEPDGFAHPDITMLQRSGRSSTTKPGLTVWTSRGEGAVEKRYFVPDTDDHVLLEIDYSNADARIVAALSGDKEYMKHLTLEDGHTANAITAWGAETVATDPKGYRYQAKALGHGWSYGGGPKALARASGAPLEAAERFCEAMAQKFRVLMAWQDHVRQQARPGYVVNAWGRRMQVEKDRAYTQAPALHGQSGTRELMGDAFIRMAEKDFRIVRAIKAWIHDALVFSVSRDEVESWRQGLYELMETELNGIPFPVDSAYGDNWYTASH